MGFDEILELLLLLTVVVVFINSIHFEYIYARAVFIDSRSSSRSRNYWTPAEFRT